MRLVVAVGIGLLVVATVAQDTGGRWFERARLQACRHWHSCKPALAAEGETSGPKGRPTRNLLKEAVYENLPDLNFEFKAGKFPDAEYVTTKATLEEEAAAVLAEIARLEPFGSAITKRKGATM
jgi:hypothetical protein